MATKKMSVLLLLVSLLSCGTDDSEDPAQVMSVVEGVSICSSITDEELQAVTAVIQGFRRLSSEDPEWAGLSSRPDQCLFFARSMDQEIPQVCRTTGGCQSSECADRWGDLPKVLDVAATDQSVGLGGYAGDEVIFINRMGSKEDDLIGLLRHELAHALADLDHGPELKELEKAVAPYINEMMANAL
ncbi:MAG: hypothetical protein AB1640_16555 [bacterium]